MLGQSEAAAHRLIRFGLSRYDGTSGVILFRLSHMTCALLVLTALRQTRLRNDLARFAYRFDVDRLLHGTRAGKQREVG